MVPWLHAANSNALIRVSVNRWLTSVLPPTTAGHFAGSFGKNGDKKPVGRSNLTFRVSPSFRLISFRRAV
ncbi:MAG: hypothetical protein IPF93_08850 [Saprospiraceae bacterium]|nr:hypothetical protein [Saprospiraceae bacterium]